MTKEELIKKWLKVKLAELYEESQCEVPEISQEIIKGKMIAIKESLFFIDSMQEEPVSNDFEMALAEMINKAQTSVVEPLVVAAQWKDELIKLAKSEEPVSEEWIEELRTKLGSMSKEDFKKVFDKYAVDFNEETVSDDLEEEITDYINNHFSECEDGVLLSDAHSSELQYTDVADIARHFVNWQKQQDSKLPKIWPRDTIEEYAYQCAYDLSNDWAKETPEWNDVQNACILGAQWQKEKDMQKFLHSETATFTREEFDAEMEEVRKQTEEQMMKDAVEGVITFDYYGDGDKTYGCIAHDSFCLEDMGLKDGDKVKLVIIKED